MVTILDSCIFLADKSDGWQIYGENSVLMRLRL